MGEVDWEKRARELINWSEDVEQALQLGREMAAHARTEERNAIWLVSARQELQRQAADARAEEIAADCLRAAALKMDAFSSFPEGLRQAAAIARSFISKQEPAADKDIACSLAAALGPPSNYFNRAETAIRADEREKIAGWLQHEVDKGYWMHAAAKALEWAAETLRPPKPKTREAALEDALREIADSTSKDNIYGDQKRLTAKRALEWRPEP